MKLVVTVTLLIVFECCNCIVPPLDCTVNVNLTLGPVCGGQVNTTAGTPGILFLGLPFASPPVHGFRFSAPEPLTAWNSTLNCTEYKAACAQSGMPGSSEDCLYLNVFSSANCTVNSTCAVDVFVHGGDFNSQSPVQFDNVEAILDNFAGRGVVLVTVAYRLAGFGFFSSNTTEAMGNWAMYDLIEALKFVKREIRNFGGDSGNITLHGSGSGAEAVSLLSMTNATQDLFNRTVQIGGSAFNKAAVLNDNLTASHKLAQSLGCANSSTWTDPAANMSVVLACMRNASTQEILDAQDNLNASGIVFPGPRIDGASGLFAGNVSIVAANRSAYQMFIGTSLYEYAPQIRLQYPSPTVADIATVCAEAVGNSTNTSDIMNSTCVGFYSTLGAPNATISDELVALINDVTAFEPTYHDASSMRNAGGPVFLHSIDYTKAGLEGVFPSNGFDSAWLMGQQLWAPETPQDIVVKDKYLELLTNFTKFGHPTPDPASIVDYWIPLLFSGAANYYSINTTCTNELSYHSRARLFWDTGPKIIDKIASKPSKKPANNDTTKILVQLISKSVKEEVVQAQPVDNKLSLQYLSLITQFSDEPIQIEPMSSHMNNAVDTHEHMVMIWITVGLVGVMCISIGSVLLYRRSKKCIACASKRQENGETTKLLS